MSTIGPWDSSSDMMIPRTLVPQKTVPCLGKVQSSSRSCEVTQKQKRTSLHLRISQYKQVVTRYCRKPREITPPPPRIFRAGIVANAEGVLSTMKDGSVYATLTTKCFQSHCFVVRALYKYVLKENGSESCPTEYVNPAVLHGI